MRSEIHAAVPLWINTPLEPPLPSGSPVTERWRLVQKHLPPLAELLDVEIVLMSAGYCVGGTGTHRAGGTARIWRISPARCPRAGM